MQDAEAAKGNTKRWSNHKYLTCLKTQPPEPSKSWYTYFEGLCFCFDRKLDVASCPYFKKIIPLVKVVHVWVSDSLVVAKKNEITKICIEVMHYIDANLDQRRERERACVCEREWENHVAEVKVIYM